MEDTEKDMIVIKEMTIDQLAGAVVLFLGAVGSLLLVIWQSRCACRCRIGLSDHCYLFDCSREPPTQEQLDNLKEEAQSASSENKNKKKDSTSKRGAMRIAEGNNDLKKTKKEEDKNKLWGQAEGEDPETIQSPKPEPEPQVQSPEIEKLI